MVNIRGPPRCSQRRRTWRQVVIPLGVRQISFCKKSRGYKGAQRRSRGQIARERWGDLCRHGAERPLGSMQTPLAPSNDRGELVGRQPQLNGICYLAS